MSDASWSLNGRTPDDFAAAVSHPSRVSVYEAGGVGRGSRELIADVRSAA
jgi:hypothetical protein